MDSVSGKAVIKEKEGNPSIFSTLTGNIQFDLALKGVILFIGLVVCVSIFDKLIDWILQGYLDQDKTKITLRHFSWYLSDFTSIGAIQGFFKDITLNKNGILAVPFFYIFLLCVYTALTAVAYLSVFVNKRAITTSSCQVLLYVVLGWVFVKQVLFVVLIPPWQAPDEIFHYRYVRALSPDTNATIVKEVSESADIFEYHKYSELKFKACIDCGNENIKRRQPPLYYWVCDTIINILGKPSLPDALYIGRMVSSACIMLTILMVFGITRKVIPEPYSMSASLFSTFLAASFPQYSFIGATFGGDAMVTMFTTGAIFFLINSVYMSHSNRKTVIYFFLSLFMAFLAISTKLTGFSVLPIIALGTITICYTHFRENKKARAFYGVLSILLLLFFLLSAWFFDFFGEQTFLKTQVYTYLQRVSWSYDDWGLSQIKRLAVLFISFWITFGLMVYKASLGTYLVLLLLTSLVVFGVVLNFVTHSLPIKRKALFLLIIYGLMSLLFMTHKDPQGRFLYVAISSWSIFYFIGLFSIFPKKWREGTIQIITGNFLLLNALVVFGILIPAFYSPLVVHVKGISVTTPFQ